MSQEVVTAEQGQPPANLFGRAPAGNGVNAGAVSIESERAIAEAQGQLILAKRFPRDLTGAYAELMEACKYPAMASVAFYTVPRAGSRVTGPSIRLAEEIARIVGNFEYGHRELARDHEKSEVEVYAWDKEKNNRSIRQITVMHVLDTRDGPRKLRDQKDIDDKIANVASKQVRGRILALMPKFLVESAIQECRKTLAGDNTVPLIDRVRRMTQAFAPYGVTTEHLETHLGHKLDLTTADELVDLTGIHNALRDGGKPSDYFGANAAEDKPEGGAAEKITAASKKGAAKEPAKTADPKPTTASSPPPSPPPPPASPPAAVVEPKVEPEPAVEQRAQPEPEQASEVETVTETVDADGVVTETQAASPPPPPAAEPAADAKPREAVF